MVSDAGSYDDGYDARGYKVFTLKNTLEERRTGSRQPWRRGRRRLDKRSEVAFGVGEGIGQCDCKLEKENWGREIEQEAIASVMITLAERTTKVREKVGGPSWVRAGAKRCACTSKKEKEEKARERTEEKEAEARERMEEKEAEAQVRMREIGEDKQQRMIQSMERRVDGMRRWRALIGELEANNLLYAGPISYTWLLFA
ncbi:hypothetical protein K1719_036159 [Acacia pycnantha]|nr:hypothetical protein K1719_036159 [Acacia pycnantha]